MSDVSSRPSRVTAIETQQRDPERVNVFIDGAFAFGLPALVAVQESLRVGDALSEERIARLRALDEQAKAVNAAMNLLARRPRSEREIRDRLKRKGYPPETIDAAVGKLEGWRYLDDEAFARYWVENREANKPRGRRLLEQELRLKGVDRETIRQTIDETELDESSAALSLARTKLRTYGKLDPAVARRRLGAFLVRRGYGYDVVKPVLDQLFGEHQDDETEPSDNP
ncbi:MAG TPA: RecX family transcriptional regulator [Thermomicrobiales bacterium]|nr:RecX family transcriptional regulator [Thermomicrobiales bacterium]